MSVKEKSKDSSVKNDSSSNQKSQQAASQAPDGGYGWVVLAASFLVSFILDGVMYSFGIILDGIKANLKAPDAEANLLSSLNTGFLFCSGPIVAGLANNFGCRAVVMGGAVVTSIMYIITAFAPNIYVMMATYGVIGGVSTGCTYIASLIIIAEYFDKKRGIATGITMAGSGVGSFVFAPLVGYIIETNDWKFTMSICACIIFQTCVCGAFLRPLEKSPSSSKPKPVELKDLKQKGVGSEESSNLAEVMGSKQIVQTFGGSVVSLNMEKLPLHQRNAFLRISYGILKEMTDFRLLWKNLGFLLITLSNFFLFTGYFTPFLYITKLAQDNGFSKGQASFLISIIGIVNIPARMLYGFIADRKFISAINLNTFSVMIATIPLFFYKAVQSYYWGQVLFSVLFAVGIAGMNSLTTMYLVDLVGMKKFSNATGIINLFRGFGCFLGPFLGGAIATKFGEVNSFFFSGICFIVGLVLTLVVSFLSYFKKCCNKSKNTDNAEKVDVEDPELNKNLLNK